MSGRPLRNRSPEFQSSPALKDRCNSSSGAVSLPGCVFQSSPALKDRCNSTSRPSPPLIRRFQSSPALKDRCNSLLRFRAWEDAMVSILTGLERPVQPPKVPKTWEASDVSILTGLERPVQRNGRGLPRRLTHRFNPPRPRKTGATTDAHLFRVCYQLFQSSPALKDRCNEVQRGYAQSNLRFNPHRP